MTRIVRWNPFQEIVDMQRQLDRVFDDINTRFGEIEWTQSGNWLALDVHETNNNYLVEMDLAGINTDDVNITLHENVLTITAEINREEASEDTRQILSERRYGKFQRSIRLPEAVDDDNTIANYENGVLTLTLPKTEASKPRQIAINNRAMLTTEN